MKMQKTTEMENQAKKAWRGYEEALNKWKEFLQKKEERQTRWEVQPYNPYSSGQTEISISNANVTKYLT
jgi:hypothetical protein